MTLQRGDSVTINSPGDFAGDVEPHGNPRMHGTRAMVLEVTDWGYVLAAPAAATGHYRASAEEVVPAGDSAAAARAKGYTGDCCVTCGGTRMVRAGVCLKCEDCGDTSGGCS